MTKEHAKEVILTDVCCHYANNKNKICTTLCPWRNKDCENIVINEEVVLKALKVLDGGRDL